MGSMVGYSKAAMERAMKVQEVILRAMAKRITWWQAAEIVGISDRWMRRWREGYQEFGYDGLFDKRRGKASARRVPMALAEQVLQFYREKYFDLNVLHFHQKLVEEHGIRLSYTWVKLALQGAGLVARERKRGVHRKRRQRRPLTVMAGLKEVIARQGVFCALYSDRGSHFWLTPKVGGKVDPHRLTQVGRALRELGIQMIPAYSPQARGRSERNFRTWQGRLPQELRLHGVETVEAANQFLREHYVAEFNRRFRVSPQQPGSAFLSRGKRDLDQIFSLQFERTVNRDNTVQFQNLNLQIERVRWKASLAGCSVTVHQHLDGTLSLRYGPQQLGRYSSQGELLPKPMAQARVVEKTRRGKVQNSTFPPRLEIPPTARDSHFPTTPAAAG